jgi:uncharacterized protein YkwD
LAGGVKSTLRGTLGTVLAAFLAGCAHPSPPEASLGPGPLARLVAPADFDHALLATAIFEETNRVRIENRLPPFGHLPELDRAADVQATDMAMLLRAEHGNPVRGEHTVAERVAAAGLPYGRMGENVSMVPARPPLGSPDRAYTYAGLAASLVQGWMDSPGHRANLLERNFTHLGCAARMAHGVPGDDRVFAVQDFFQPAKPAEPDR